jgi:outer membrane protein
MRKTILGGLIAALLMLPAAASAQKSEVLVMNQAEVLTKSRAGQSIQTQIQAFATSAEGELRSQGERLQNEAQALQASKDSLGKDDLQKRANALMQGFQQLGQIKQAEIAQAEAQALTDLSKQLEPIIQDIAKKRKAKAVLRRTDVAWVDDDADITNEVIAALDKRVQTIAVTKPDLLAQARAAQAGQ